MNPPLHNCPAAGCNACEEWAERAAEERNLGDPMPERDWDRWEAGPGWNSYPGMPGWGA